MRSDGLTCPLFGHVAIRRVDPKRPARPSPLQPRSLTTCGDRPNPFARPERYHEKQRKLMDSRSCSWFPTRIRCMATLDSSLREESKGENEGPSASFFCSPPRTTRSRSPQQDRKSAPLQVPPDEINSRKTRSHEHTTSRNRNRSLIGRSGSSETSKPSQAKASPRQSILIMQTDTRSKETRAGS
jgi:hypothetical protein